MILREFYVPNGDIKLHCLGNNGTSKEPPLIFVPGLWGHAGQFTELLTALSGRRAFALSLRGRGRSDVPESGYSLQDHVSDIKAFIDFLNLDQVILITVSAGATYAIEYAAQYSEKLARLVLTDYPAISKSYPPQMVEGVLNELKELSISETFLRGLQRESIAVDLVSELKRIDCPVTIFRGGRTGSYLNEDHIKTYLQNLAKVAVQVIPEVAHDPLLAPDDFIRALESEI